MPEFTQRSQMPCSVDELFDWHMRPGAFARLSPPWDRVEVERWAAPDQLGRQAILRVRLAPFVWKRWIAEYREYVPGRMFRDVQISGPFAAFDHRHLMTPASAESAWLEDRIDYAAPLGAFGQWVAGRWLRRSLENLFAYRHRTTADDLAALHVAGGPPLRVLLSGSTGLVGSSLVPFLTAGGHTVERLVRARESSTSRSCPGRRSTTPHRRRIRSTGLTLSCTLPAKGSRRDAGRTRRRTAFATVASTARTACAEP